MARWDVFISHASEDKNAVASPLAKQLSEAGLRVWLDAHELQIGDSLRHKIDLGLANSRFGVVVLSEDFFAKRWPQNELNGLFATEEGGFGTILPVWHNIDKASISKYSPMMADRIAVNTSEGIDVVGRQILQRVTKDARIRPSVLMKLNELVELGTPTSKTRALLQSYPKLIQFALGSSLGPTDGSTVYVAPSIDGDCFDFAVVIHQSTLRLTGIAIVQLSTVAAELIDTNGTIPELSTAIEKCEAVCAKFPRAGTDVHGLWTHEHVGLRAFLVTGRRSTSANQIRDINESLKEVEVRTYDWLLDTARAYFCGPEQESGLTLQRSESLNITLGGNPTQN